ncbi:MAG: tetratricopeptide repeat protein [Planctomycetota bacterium]
MRRQAPESRRSPRAAASLSARSLSQLLALALLVSTVIGCRSAQPADARLVRAEAYTRAEAWADAASLWSEIYRASGGEDRHAGLESARAYLASGRVSVAVVRLGELQRRWPQDPEVLERLGAAHEAAGDDAAARSAYAAALEREPTRPVSLARVGVLGAAAGLPAAARESLRRLRASGAISAADADSLFDLGLVAARDGRLDEAFEALSLALETDSPEASRRLSAAKALAPDPRVIPWLADLVREDPLHTAALTLLGRTQVRLGLVEQGLGSLEQAVSSDPSDADAVKAYAAALEEAGQSARASEVRALLGDGDAESGDAEVNSP